MTLPSRRPGLRFLALLAGAALAAPSWAASPGRAAPKTPAHAAVTPGLSGSAPPFRVVADPFPHPDESWATPTLAGTRLTPDKPLVLQTEDRPTFTRQVVRVQWRRNDPLELYVVRPKGVARPPVVLYLYGYPSDTHRFLLDSYCERLTRGGCAAVGFESALTGGRYHDRPMREWFVSQLNEALAESAHDVPQILDYLTTRGDLDVTRAGMFGQGSGGAVAVLAAGADPRLKAIDLLSPWGDWGAWLPRSAMVPDSERPGYLAPAFAARVRPLDPVSWLPRLKGRRVRILQLADDADVPVAARRALAKAAPPGAEVKEYASSLNAYGRYRDGRLFAWIGEQLGAAPALSASAR